MKKRSMKKKAVVLMLIVFLLYGLVFLKDYGISYDEPIQRQHGLISFKYVLDKLGCKVPEALSELPGLESYEHRFYGIAIKIPLLLYEYLHNFSLSNQEIYYVNHLYTFLLFFFSAIYLYRITKLLKWEGWHPALALLLYIICPRITADAFYNIKDSVFLSTYVIMLYYTLVIMSDHGWKNTLGLIVSAALCVNTRFIGAIPLVITAIAYMIQRGRKELGRSVAYVFIVIIGVLSVYVLLTPASWSNPAKYLLSVMNTFTDYSWQGYTVIGGNGYYSENLPWYYLGLCIILTMPTIYWVLTPVGVISKIGKLVKGEKKAHGSKLVSILLVEFLLVFTLDAVRRPVKYNMWRHYYFLFVYLVVFCVVGFDAIAKRGIVPKRIIGAVTAISSIFTVGWQCVNHPFEYVYFNPLFPMTAESTEGDYWHTSDINLLKAANTGTGMDVYPNVNSNIFFGETGWENYHSIEEAYRSEYMLSKGYDRMMDLLYKKTSDIQVGNMTVSKIVKRNNYHGIVEMYRFSKDGTCTPINKQQDLTWNVTVTDSSFIYEAEAASLYRAELREMDVIFGDTDVRIDGIEAQMSPNGANWYHIEDSNIVRNDQFSAVLIPNRAEIKKMRIQLNYINETGRVPRLPELLIRVFRRENYKNYSYMTVSHNEQDLDYMLDGDMQTRWTSNTPLTKGMYLEWGYGKDVFVDRINLELGSSRGDYLRDMTVYIKTDTDEWKPIKASYLEDKETILFEKAEYCSAIRIVEQSDGIGLWWSIAEFDARPMSNYDWSVSETASLVEAIYTNYVPDESGNMIEGSVYTATNTLYPDPKILNSEVSQNPDMEIILKLVPDNGVKGLHIYAGADCFKTACQLEIMGSEDGINWENVSYHFITPYNIVFDNDKAYIWYKLKQTGTDDRHSWAICDLGLLKDRTIS